MAPNTLGCFPTFLALFPNFPAGPATWEGGLVIGSKTPNNNNFPGVIPSAGTVIDFIQLYFFPPSRKTIYDESGGFFP